MKKTLIMLFAFTLLAVSASATEKKYLVLGADPQAKDRQPIPEVEEVVVIDADICDSGWGTGSGKKVPGCYPKHSALIRNKVTGIVTAAFVCGNKPSDKHVVTGKVVEGEVRVEIQERIKEVMIPNPNAVTLADLESAIREATKVSRPPEFDSTLDRGWCRIFATNKRCNIASGLLALGIGGAVSRGGDHDKKGPDVTTKKPTFP